MLYGTLRHINDLREGEIIVSDDKHKADQATDGENTIAGAIYGQAQELIQSFLTVEMMNGWTFIPPLRDTTSEEPILQ